MRPVATGAEALIVEDKRYYVVLSFENDPKTVGNASTLDAAINMLPCFPGDCEVFAVNADEQHAVERMFPGIKIQAKAPRGMNKRSFSLVDGQVKVS